MSAIPVISLNELIESGVIQLTRGKIISKKDIAACPGSYPIYSSAKDNDGKFGEYGKYLFDEELITWSVDGGGRLFHRPKHKFSVTNVGGVLRIRDASLIDYRYLFYVLTLRHSEISFDWVKKAHPSVIRKLYTDIPLPPLLEQQRIAALLDEVFAGLATAKANAERNLQNARAVFESHLESVFNGRGDGWANKALGELCDILDNRRKPITKRNRVPGDIPYYGATGIKDYVNGFIFDEPLVLVGEDGAKWGSGDKTAFAVSGKSWVNNHAHVLRPHRELLTDYWLISYLVHADLSPFVSGLTVPKLNQASLREIPIPLPPLQVQAQLVMNTKALEGEIQRLARICERKLAALEELRKSILRQAFNGQL